ncbi:MAG TPA: hypothetical protein VFB10_04155 [Candidatus Dormibacteraeota bacterium]|nr:hypothetical protein [Candidatus Dormibacteraeota bacterium]
MALLSDHQLEKVESSKAYLAVDLVFNWIGYIGELLLLLYLINYWRRLPGTFWFWMKAFLLSVILMFISTIKDEVFAWAGIAPPDHFKWFGPRQEPSRSPGMDVILNAQNRGSRILARGIRVARLLDENEAIFRRRQRSQN